MRMMLRLAAATVLAVLAIPARADGIPVSPDRREVTVDHWTIRLNRSQVKEVERTRKVTLTRRQLKPLQAIYAGVPATLDVMSSRYDGCTCGMGVYAIWCHPGSVEIPMDSVEFQKAVDEYNREHPESEGDWDGRTEYRNQEVIVDSRGAMYADGKVLKEPDVFAAIDNMRQEMAKNGRLSCWVNLDPPPPIDAETDARVRELSDRIAAYCQKQGVQYWALGFSDDSWEVSVSTGLTRGK